MKSPYLVNILCHDVDPTRYMLNFSETYSDNGAVLKDLFIPVRGLQNLLLGSLFLLASAALLLLAPILAALFISVMSFSKMDSNDLGESPILTNPLKKNDYYIIAALTVGVPAVVAILGCCHLLTGLARIAMTPVTYLAKISFRMMLSCCSKTPQHENTMNMHPYDLAPAYQPDLGITASNKKFSKISVFTPLRAITSKKSFFDSFSDTSENEEPKQPSILGTIVQKRFGRK